MGMKRNRCSQRSIFLGFIDDNFASIVYAIRSEEEIFDNLQKPCLIFLLSTFRLLVWSYCLHFILLFLCQFYWMPMVIVFMELINSFVLLLFESEQEEKGIMK